MRRAIPLTIGLVAVCAILVAWWASSWLGGDARRPASPNEKAAETGTASGLPELVSASQPAPTVDTAASAPITKARSEIPTAALAGVVLDHAGAPVSDAVVTWTRLPADLAAGLLVAPSVEEIDQLTVSTLTDSLGHFALPDPAPGDPQVASVLWASAERHEAVFAWLEELPSEETRLQLGPERSSSALVVSGELPVAGALVEERGVLEGVTREALARTLFRRTFQTSGDGSVHVAPIAGVVELVARKDRSVSTPLLDVLSEEQVLHLDETFEAAGHVAIEGGALLEDPLRVSVSLLRQGRESFLVMLLVAADGSFGPLRVPHLEGAAYAFRTQGGGVAPDEATHASPGVDGRLQVELAVSSGHRARFVLASEGERLRIGSVMLDWQADDGRKGRVTRAVDDKGEASFTGLPAGSIVATGRAPRHVTLPGSTFRVPEQTGAAWTVQVFPAGRLVGHVRHRGQPVEDFTVVFWPTGSAYFQQQRSFLGRGDGRFELEEAPLGDVSILAWAERGARSTIAQVQVFAEGSAQDVVLELGEPIVVTGEVVNEEGTALPEASVTLFFAEQGNLVGPLGSEVRADEGGRFRIQNAPEMGSICVVRCPGHSAQELNVSAGRGPIDLGRIRLLSQQELDIRLSGPQAFDPADYYVAAAGGALLPRAFSAGGLVHYEGVDAGEYQLMLMHPDRSIQWQPILLRRGEQWSVSMVVEGGATLIAEVEGEIPDGAQLPLSLHLIGPGGPWDGERQLQIHDSRKGLRIDSLTPGDVVVSVADASEQPLIRQGLRLAPGENTVRLRIDEPPMWVVVVDPHGEPVAGAQVALFQMPAGTALGDATCDASGECRFRGVGEGGTPLLATVSHDDYGIASGLPLEVPHDLDEPAVLVLEAEASIVLRIQDGDEPQEGVIVELCDELPNGSVLATSPPSDAEGLVRWDRLAPGTYHAIAHQDPRYWRGDAHVIARLDPAPVPLQLLKRASLRLRVVDSSGFPIEGLAITVSSQQYGRPITDFLPSGMIDVEPPSSRTDEAGELLLSRIPRGHYIWQITFADGNSQRGEVDLPGWQETSVVIQRAP